MILSYQEFKINNKSVFEKVVFNPPFKPNVTYIDEVCFVHSVMGSGISYGGIDAEIISTKDNVLMKCGSFVNHWQRVDGDGPCEIIAIHITPEILNVIYKNKLPSFIASKFTNENKSVLKISQIGVIDEYINSLKFYFDYPDTITDDLIHLKLKELILLLYNLNYDYISKSLRSLFCPAELSFKSVVEAHIYADLEILDLAKLTNTSLSTFKRKFKQIYNDTPAKYLLHKRMTNAARLLLKSDDSITNIAFESGFKNLSSFTRAFVKKFGVTPTNYRIS